MVQTGARMEAASAPPRVVYEVDFVEQRSRLTTLVRWLLAIPHYLVLFLYGIGAFVAVVIAWFALVFTGRWPVEGIHGALRFCLSYAARALAYAALLTEEWPPISDEPAAPATPFAAPEHPGAA